MDNSEKIKSPCGRFLKLDKIVGEGAYKKVYEAFDTSMGKKVAWNSIYVGNLGEKDQNLIINEIQTLHNLGNECAHIIHFYGSWYNSEKEEIVFITELASSGSIKKFRNEMKEIQMKAIKIWFFQIMKGIDFLHKNNLVHRDIKAENIFINGTTGNIIIGDLGLSFKIKKRKDNSVLGTPEFMAPETFDGNYDNKIDIYGLGMTLLEIITNETPYLECDNVPQIWKKKTKGIFPKSLDNVENENIKGIIKKCINFHPKKRPSIKDLLAMDFFNNTEDDTQVFSKSASEIELNKKKVIIN